jgi:hypothetical protein
MMRKGLYYVAMAEALTKNSNFEQFIFAGRIYA